MSNEELELLKKMLHPEKQMNIIDQCRIVSESLQEGSSYFGNSEGLAIYLELSPSKVYQMQRVWKDMIPELKEWFRKTEYQCRTAYDVAVLSEKGQRDWLKDMLILVTGTYTPPSNSLSQKVKTEGA